MAKPTKREKQAEKVFNRVRETMKKVLAIPAEEARAICERTAPGQPRQVEGMRGTMPRRGR